MNTKKKAFPCSGIHGTLSSKSIEQKNYLKSLYYGRPGKSIHQFGFYAETCGIYWRVSGLVWGINTMTKGITFICYRTGVCISLYRNKA